ncbi:MAG: NFACT family protein [Candidatus ainarchaeum sp.]|nr:NFACT family protein [Candidatus ainarchaeum sp.]
MEKILLNNLNVKYFERNLDNTLTNAYIQKIQPLEKNENALKIKVKSKDVNYDLIVFDGFLFLTKYNYKTSEKTGFCKNLEKQLGNEKILKIEQKDFEKVIVFETRNNFLIFELFSHNNIILTDKDYKIIASQAREKWADREIGTNKTYIFPSNNKKSPAKITEFNFNSISDIISKLNVPPSLVEHFAKEDPNPNSIARKIKKIYTGPIAIDCCAFLKSKKLEYFNTKIEDLETIKTGFNDIVDKYINSLESATLEKSGVNKKSLELEATIKKMDLKVEGFKKSITEDCEKAKWIEANYDFLEELRLTVLKALENGKKPDEILKILKVKGKNYPLLQNLVKIDMKNKKIIFSIPQLQQ